MPTTEPIIDHRAELEQLAAYLFDYANRKPPNFYFYLAYWCQYLGELLAEDIDNISPTRPSRKAIQCGYAACAIGHLPYACPTTELSIGQNNTVLYEKDDQTYTDFAAIATYFNLTENQAYRLFSPMYYPLQDKSNPAAVAVRIEQFLALHPVATDAAIPS